MSASAPLVSVCIPTYNGAQTLGAAIDSVLAQTLTAFELVVIDDQSPDGTRELVASYADARIRYLRNDTNLGPEGNWNRCLLEARGTYFKLLPHDDVLHPACLQRQVGAFCADHEQGISLVFSAREVLGPEGQLLTRRGYPGAREGRLQAREVMGACVRRGTNLLGEPGAVLIRKSLTNKVGLFDATFPYVIDLDYWFRLLRYGDAYYCQDALAGFRVSGTQWSVAIGSRQSQDFRGFIERVKAQGALSATALDRGLGFFTPALNNVARLLFYRFYLR